MSKTNKKPTSLTTADGVNLGRWLGRRDAFGLIAGRCSAAEVESLRRIRDDKLYLASARNWNEFCTSHVGASRRSIDRNIGHLEEFGPAFFQISQMSQISVPEYRTIAAHITTDGIQLDGVVIPLQQEKCEQVTAAVTRLLREAEPAKPEKRAPAFAPLLKRIDSCARQLDAYGWELDTPDKLDLAEVLARMRQAAAERGVIVPRR